MEVDYLIIDMTKMAESNFLTQPRFLTLVSKLARLFNVAWQITYWLYSKTVANATLQEYGNDVYWKYLIPVQLGTTVIMVSFEFEIWHYWDETTS